MANETLVKHLATFKMGDKRQKNLLRAVQALSAGFGESEGEALMPAAMNRMAQAAKAGGGLQGHNMPPPGMGLQLGGPGPMAPPGGGGPPPGMG